MLLTSHLPIKIRHVKYSEKSPKILCPDNHCYHEISNFFQVFECSFRILDEKFTNNVSHASQTSQKVLKTRKIIHFSM